MKAANSIQPMFDLGQTCMTPGAFRELENAGLTPSDYLRRHVSGDFGDVPLSDVRANQQALIDGCRILSAYTLPTKVRLWIITEADRSVTTLLLPEEY